MSTRIREYHRPQDRQEATNLLRHGAPLVLSPKPIALEDISTEAVVDLSRLDLTYITNTGDGFIHLGALTPLADLVQSPVLQSLASGLLSEAAHLSAHRGLRNLATVGGVLMASDGPPEVLLALLALDAVVVTRTADGHTRETLLSALIPSGATTRPEQKGSPSPERSEGEPRERGASHGAGGWGELLIEVKFPHADSAKGALARVARTPRDGAIVAAVAVLEIENGLIRRARLAVAGAHPRSTRLPSIDKMLEAQTLSDDLLHSVEQAASSQANPLPDYRGSAEYRRAMAGVMVRRAIASASDRT